MKIRYAVILAMLSAAALSAGCMTVGSVSPEFAEQVNRAEVMLVEKADLEVVTYDVTKNLGRTWLDEQRVKFRRTLEARFGSFCKYHGMGVHAMCPPSIKVVPGSVLPDGVEESSALRLRVEVKYDKSTLHEWGFNMTARFTLLDGMGDRVLARMETYAPALTEKPAGALSSHESYTPELSAAAETFYNFVHGRLVSYATMFGK